MRKIEKDENILKNFVTLTPYDLAISNNLYILLFGVFASIFVSSLLDLSKIVFIQIGIINTVFDAINMTASLSILFVCYKVIHANGKFQAFILKNYSKEINKKPTNKIKQADIISHYKREEKYKKLFYCFCGAYVLVIFARVLCVNYSDCLMTLYSCIVDLIKM